MPTTPNGNPDGYINGIPYEEANGSGTLKTTATGSEGERIFNVAWTSSEDFAVALVGTKVTDNDPTTPNQYTIEPHSFSSTQPNLICTGATRKGLGAPSNSNGNAAYEYAQITATYTPKVTEDGEVIANQDMDIGGEFYEFGEFDLFWEDGTGTGQKAQNRKVVAETQHTFTEEYCTTNKKDIINARAGKINSSAYQGVAAEQLLYLGASMTRQITTDGKQAWKITHKFTERIGESWNKFYRPSTQAYESVYDKDENIIEIYESTDFDGLLDADSN